MVELHCHSCGGFINGLRYIAYRAPTVDATPAAANSGLCDCDPPIQYGPPPGFLTSPGMMIPGHRGAGE